MRTCPHSHALQSIHGKLWWRMHWQDSSRAQIIHARRRPPIIAIEVLEVGLLCLTPTACRHPQTLATSLFVQDLSVELANLADLCLDHLSLLLLTVVANLIGPVDEVHSLLPGQSLPLLGMLLHKARPNNAIVLLA